MIKKSLAACLVFFVVYSLVLMLVHVDKKTNQYQYQENIMKGQRYLFNPEAPKSVIVGTSLSDKMVTDSLGGTFNLSLAGLNVFDGLHIILKREDLPKVVFIEINNFFHPENRSFTGLFDARFGNTLKMNFKALRESNQPVGLARYYLSRLLRPKSQSDDKKKLVNEIPVPYPVFSQLLKEKQAQFSIVDTALIGRSLDELQERVAAIVSRGTRVVFFEMPISPDLEELPLPSYVRSAIMGRFKRSEGVQFIERPGTYNFKTVDGIHLNPYGAWEYTKYFRQQAVEVL